MPVAIIFWLVNFCLWLMEITGCSGPWHYDNRRKACGGWTGHLHIRHPREQCCRTGENRIEQRSFYVLK
ncbi:hypothetical protein TNCV_1570421 [Trichonephila clavipes]|uniref:Secreted protein n=1 Tax=Trichonephila clavipes TaxID=2585209 RepID=A0A8X6SVL1_TRICX|nr:hypothetical protein TNCV_1570421 [Trichonephila clavipes]